MTMDKVAQEIEYAKGTVYQHFTCKEEIISALAKVATEKRHTLFARGFQFDGRTRERATAVSVGVEVFARVHWQELKIQTLLNAESLRQKTSKESQDKLVEADRRAKIRR